MDFISDMNASILTKEIDGHQFAFSSVPGATAIRLAPRAAAHYGACGHALFMGGNANMMVAFGERMSASEVDFWTSLLWPLTECDGRPMKVAVEGRLLKAGAATGWKALWVAMDHSCGPFGGIADMFRPLQPPVEEEKPADPEPSPSSESET